MDCPPDSLHRPRLERSLHLLLAFATLFVMLGPPTTDAPLAQEQQTDEGTRQRPEETGEGRSRSTDDSEGEGASKDEEELPFAATGPVAVVDGAKISAAQYNGQVRRLARRIVDLPVEILVAQRDRILERLIDQKLLELEVERMGIEVSSSEVDEALERFADRFPSTEALERFSARQQVTAAQLRKQMKKSLLFKKYLIETSRLDLSKEALRRHYKKHIDRYREPERVEARHILIRVSAKATAEQIADARERAEKLAERARGEEVDFAELARANSEGPGATRGGLLEYFARDRMVEPFSRAAFQMTVGEISEPVRTKFGFHVIKVTGKKDAETKSFEEVEDSIEKRLENEGLRDAMKSTIERLRAEAEIEKMPENIEIYVENSRGQP
jgi:parvulin-like peptidyl-prolyl isomerase